MDEVFKALADPSRRLLLDALNARNGQSLRELCAGLDMARQSVSKHLAILEDANLVTTLRHGREKLHYLNPAPINEIAERWINRYDSARVLALADLKLALEGGSMDDQTLDAKQAADKPQFVYTNYIRTTPKRLWQALTEPAFTRRYWGLAFASDWKQGSTLTFEFGDGTVVADPEQVVLESDPYRRLSYTWHTFTREWARASGMDEQQWRAFAAEPRSRVVFELEDVGDMVKLTVLHDGLAPGGAVLEAIRGGWPRVLSGLKTLLETGSDIGADTAAGDGADTEPGPQAAS